MKRILIIGAGGLIGTAIRNTLKHYEYGTLSGRSIKDKTIEEIADAINGYDVLINLAGRSVFTRWTRKNKKLIYNSRILTTRKIVGAINHMENPPMHVINASAIGIYKIEKYCDESIKEYSDNFLSKVVRDWENELSGIKKESVNLSILRIGIVLSTEGGAYHVLRSLTRYNVGAYFNGGRQSLSFIYIYDLVRAIDFIIMKQITGIINIVSPEVTSYKILMEHLKKQFHALIIWNLPGIVVKLIFGEGSILFLEGQNVKPGVLLDNNFVFEAPDILSCITKLENN